MSNQSGVGDILVGEARHPRTGLVASWSIAIVTPEGSNGSGATGVKVLEYVPTEKGQQYLADRVQHYRAA